MNKNELRNLIREEIETQVIKESIDPNILAMMLYGVFSALVVADFYRGFPTKGKPSKTPYILKWTTEDIPNKIKSMWKNFKFKRNVQPIINRLKDDKDIQAFFEQTPSSQRSGWVELLKTKLSDKELKYIHQLHKKHMS